MRKLEEARTSRAVKLQDTVRQEMQSRIMEAKKSSPVLKLRLVDCKEGVGMSVSGILSVWRPGEVWSSLLEGSRAR